ncbi:hypothetical protein [Flavobacterium sp.]|uniref:hypothetical protein n=1 Tax=Flavobacterium sp. TaxID=239 RepID=UPI003342B1B6
MKKCLFLALLFSTFGFSQNGISYQALILNPSGEQLPGQDNTHAPISNKLVCLKFAIIDHTNQIEYLETHKVSTDAYGIVNLVIGTGEKIGGYASSFSNVVWGNNPKSLKVDLDVNANCTNFVGISNQPFTYVPLAYYAANSGSSTPGPIGLTGATGPQGPIGLTGPAGTNGTNGSSAYQLAVTNGFVGTEAQWLASLVGPQGPAGATGPQGPAGADGTLTTYNSIRGNVSFVSANSYTVTGTDFYIITTGTGTTITIPTSGTGFTPSDAGRVIYIYNDNFSSVSNSWGGTPPSGNIVGLNNQYRGGAFLWSGTKWIYSGK